MLLFILFETKTDSFKVKIYYIHERIFFNSNNATFTK